MPKRVTIELPVRVPLMPKLSSSPRCPRDGFVTSFERLCTFATAFLFQSTSAEAKQSGLLHMNPPSPSRKRPHSVCMLFSQYRHTCTKLASCKSFAFIQAGCIAQFLFPVIITIAAATTPSWLPTLEGRVLSPKD